MISVPANIRPAITSILCSGGAILCNLLRLPFEVEACVISVLYLIDVGVVLHVSHLDKECADSEGNAQNLQIWTRMYVFFSCATAFGFVMTDTSSLVMFTTQLLMIAMVTVKQLLVPEKYIIWLCSRWMTLLATTGAINGW